jgi:cytochrome c oxidase subunit II
MASLRAAASPGLWLLRAAPALLPLLAACDRAAHQRQYPQTTFAPKSDFARDLDTLFMGVLILGVVVAIATFAVLAYIIVKFRYRPGHPEPEQTHGNTRLELTLTAIPAIILALIAVPTVQQIFKWQPNEVPPNTLVVNVTGFQWWWRFQYVMPGTSDTITTANEIHVPVGTPVQLRMHSNDVIHSFWVPQMGGKRDVFPGAGPNARITKILFTPEEAGVYYGQCAEFCGDSHALMRMRLVAHDPAGFQEWLRNEAGPAVAPSAADTAVLLGKQIVTTGVCAGCHTVRYGAAPDSTTRGITGPNLTHFGRRYSMAGGLLENNAQNLFRWVRNAPSVKPGSKMPQLGGDVPGALTDQQIHYVVAYLQTLQ